MLRSLNNYFLSSKLHNTSGSTTQVRLHDDLSQKEVPHRFHLEELKGLDLYESSVQEIQQHLSEGHFTSVEYVKFCLQRIRNVNPYLECIIEVNPDAITIAAELDNERRQVGRGFKPHSFEMKHLAWERMTLSLTPEHPTGYS